MSMTVTPDRRRGLVAKQPFVTTVNPKGQVTIPEPLRAKYGFLPGKRVAWIERNGEIVPHPVPRIESLFGALKRREGEPSWSELVVEEHRQQRAGEDTDP